MLLFFAPVPSAPTSLNVSHITATTITVQWEEVDCSEQNGITTGYSVEYWEVEAGNGSALNMTVSGDNATISSLLPSTKYSVRVAAENSNGTGPYSTALIVETEGMWSMYLMLFT